MQLDLSKIVISDERNLEPSSDVDLETLTTSIKQDGLKHPVLVDEDLHLIDGLQRIRAAKRLGWTKIEVTKHTIWKLAVEDLEIQNKSVLPLTEKRIWQISESLVPLSRARLRHLRTGNKETRDAYYAKWGHEVPRDQICRALGINEARYTAVRHVYKLAQPVSSDPEQAPYAQMLIDKMEAGELTAHQVSWLLLKRNRSPRTSMPVAKQVQILSDVCRMLDIASKALANLGELSPEMSSEKCQEFLESTLKSNVALTRVRVKLRKGIRK